jgi:FkbM family methyltransferase
MGIAAVPTNPMRVNTADQMLYAALLGVDKVSRSSSAYRRTLARILSKACAIPRRVLYSRNPLVRTQLWGAPLLVRAGYHVPWIVQRNPLWSQSLVHAVTALDKRPVSVIDVGANIGDSVAMLRQALPGACDFLCIEPDDEFYQLCQANTQVNSRVQIVQCFVGDSTDYAVGIVHRGIGTAETAILGSGGKSPVRLDQVAAEFACEHKGIDLIKIDTDGFDFKVIRSASGLIARWSPAIFFEWSAPEWEAKGEKPLDVFDHLRGCGYEDFVFFADNGSVYAHEKHPSRTFLQTLVELCAAKSGTGELYYFDVLAASEQVCRRAVQLNLEAIRHRS